MDDHNRKGVFTQIRERIVPFLFAFLGIFIFTLTILSWVGATPIPRESDVDTTPIVTNTGTPSPVPTETPEAPVRIVAKSINLDDAVANPVSTDLETLDRVLLKSSAHYPGSANLNEKGNMVLFGHSSYLPTVFNQAYKAFNDIQKLQPGSIITVYSGTTAYDYRVTSVKLAKADNYVIDLGGTKRRLTLVTCNSFATKSDRYVVEAEFVISYPAAR